MLIYFTFLEEIYSEILILFLEVSMVKVAYLFKNIVQYIIKKKYCFLVYDYMITSV